jgi:hypothetical protein
VNSEIDVTVVAAPAGSSAGMIVTRVDARLAER